MPTQVRVRRQWPVLGLWCTLLTILVFLFCFEEVRAQSRLDGRSGDAVSSEVRLPDMDQLPSVRPLGEATTELGPDGGLLRLDNASLRVPSGILRSNLKIGLQRISSAALPPLPPGLFNVTGGGGGYRFLPVGTEFSSDVEVTLPLRRTGSAAFWQSLGARTYYWDDDKAVWAPLDLEEYTISRSFRSTNEASESGQDQISIKSRSRHFTIMINAIVQAPEHPGPANFDETTIQPLAAGDPAANVDLIGPPTPNNQGTAEMAFPLRLPAGRGAYSPQLQLSYSSDNANGPLGVGWRLSGSSISIDLSRGVPNYDGTDRFLLDGLPLIAVKSTQEGAVCTRRIEGEPQASLVQEYAARIHRHQRIRECEGQSGRYWEVNHRDGTQYYYGVSASARLSSTDAQMTGRWFLEEVEDTNGNITKFRYWRDNYSLGGVPATLATQVYLKGIDYTSHLGESLLPAYRTELQWNCTAEEPRITLVSAKFGFVSGTRCKLKSVAVFVRNADGTSPNTEDSCYHTQALDDFAGVRCYKLEYVSSPIDGKALLDEIVVFDAEGDEFYKHALRYTQPEYTQSDSLASCLTSGPGSSGLPSAFDCGQRWSVSGLLQQGRADKARQLSVTSEDNDQDDWNVGLSLGVCTVGGSVGIGQEDSEASARLIDLNGDGIADRIWTKEALSIASLLPEDLAQDLGQLPAFFIVASVGKNYTDGLRYPEEPSRVHGIREIPADIELQDAVFGSIGVSASCSLVPGVSINASGQISLRDASTFATLTDVDGDRRADLLWGGRFYRGMPNTCRDGNPPNADSVCSDGLRVCRLDPKMLCFEPEGKDLETFGAEPASVEIVATTLTPPRNAIDRSTTSPTAVSGRGAERPSESRAVFTLRETRPSVELLDLEDRLASRVFGSNMVDSRLFKGSALSRPFEKAGPFAGEQEGSDALEAEASWGPFTAARRRLAEEDEYAASFDALRPVIRWDAQHDGTIRGRASFRLKNGGSAEGLKVSILKVSDPHSEAGTELVDEFVLNADDPEENWSDEFDVRFRWSLLFVFDPLDETSVSRRGMLLDEVETDIDLTFLTVCPIGSDCRDVERSELSHRGATRQLSYVYRFPEDFRISELPRSAYWHLLPPLGPPVTAPDGTETPNEVVVRIRKHEETETPVHVRIRCESLGSQRAGDEHTCPLGTVLDELVLSEDEIGDHILLVDVPEPFLTSETDLPEGSDCGGFARDALFVFNDGWGWTLSDGNHLITQVATRAEAIYLLKVAKHFSMNCSVGPKPAPANEVHSFFFGRVEVVGSAPQWEDVQSEADCVSYAPYSLRAEATPDEKWLLRAGNVRLMIVSTLEAAELARSYANRYSQLCFIGRGNEKQGTDFTERHRDWVHAYFDAPVKDVTDPTQILVEIDGENGFEIPPSAISAKADLSVVSLRRAQGGMRQELPAGRAPILYSGTFVETFVGEETLQKDLRVLYRVHPARHLQGFSVVSPGRRFVVVATLIGHESPLHLSLTGDHFEGAAWQEVVELDEAPGGASAITHRYEMNIEQPGHYYLRGFTEATFDLDSAVQLRAFFENCEETAGQLRCQEEDVPVNLLGADFGYPFAIPDPTTGVPIINTLGFDELAGEVAHSFESFAGGHHGFFYGIFKDGESLACIDPYPCETKKDPQPLRSHFDRLTKVRAQLKALDRGLQPMPVHRPLESGGSQVPDGGRAARDALPEVPIYRNEREIVTSFTEYALEQCFFLEERTGRKIESSDMDGDGICDPRDACPRVPDNFVVDPAVSGKPYDGCPEACVLDSDWDGIPDCYDVCPLQPGDEEAGPGAFGCAGRDSSPEGPRLAAPDPRSRIDPEDPPDDQEGCYVSGDSGTFICGDGSTHPSHRNSTGGATHEFAEGRSGFRRTWTFGANWGVGAGGPGLGISGSFGAASQYTDRDVMDWNGDGILDFVTPNVISLGGRNSSIQLPQDCYLRAGDQASAECLLRPGIQESASVSFGVSGSIGLGATGYVLHVKGTPEGQTKDQEQERPDVDSGVVQVNFSLGGSWIHNYGGVLSQRVDVNGDGLPDQIFASANGNRLGARLNLGRSFSSAIELPASGDDMPIGLGGVELTNLDFSPADVAANISNLLDLGFVKGSSSTTESFSYGGGGGLDIGIVGGSGSHYKRRGTTESTTTRELVDINGDGLVDLVSKDPSAGESIAKVAYNTGFGFEAPQAFQMRVPDTSFSGSDIHSESNSASGTLFFVKVGKAWSSSWGKSFSEVELRDLDGDGVADQVRNTGEVGGTHEVFRGLLGGANLLSRIERPFGGAIELSYERSTATEDSPGVRWNLAAIHILQDGDRYVNYPDTAKSPEILTTVEYLDRYYDRYEKQSFGYETVLITREADGRVIEREYENRDYWLRGTLLHERIGESLGEDDEVEYVETEFEYESVPWPALDNENRDTCLTGLILPVKYLDTDALRDRQETPCDIREPRLRRTVRSQYEGGDTPLVFEQSIEEYDSHGNPLRIVEVNGGARHPRLTALIDYDDRPALIAKHIVDRAMRIVVHEGGEDGPILRRREACYDVRGNLSRHETWSDPNAQPIDCEIVEPEDTELKSRLDLVPNAYGFVTSVSDANGYEITLEPDPLTYSLPVETTDSFDLVSTTDYDYRFQAATNTVDANGNLLERTYDSAGRLKTVRGPYESEYNIDSVHIEYGAIRGDAPVSAITTNRTANVETGDPVTTLRVARFVDWLGREIQVQTEAEVDGVYGRSISGRIEYDGAGRAIRVGHPIFIPHDASTAADPSFDFHAILWDEDQQACTPAGPLFCTSTTYDLLDRPLRVVTPRRPDPDDPADQGGLATTTTYHIALNPRDTSRQSRLVRTVDPKGIAHRSFFDARDQLVATARTLEGRNIVTSFDHSPVGDLLSILDARENARTFEYDLAGRRTAIVTPDTGRTEMGYDRMGNLIAQTDQELCNAAPPLLANDACSDRNIRWSYRNNRLEGIDYPDAADVSFVYGDADPEDRCADLTNTRGRICWVEDEAGTERRSFGKLGEMIAHERTMSLFGDPDRMITYKTSFEYDSFGRLQYLRYPDGEQLQYTYDRGGQVTSVKGTRDGLTTTYVSDRTYDRFGKPLSTTLGNGVIEQNAYEPGTQRLDIRSVSSGDTVLSSLDLTYDLVSNITRSVTERDPSQAIRRLERSYTYDDLYRLDTFSVTGMGSDGAAALSVNGDYDYDDVGHITRQFLEGAGAAADVSRDWTYDYDTPARPNLPDTIGSQSFGYNARGAIETITEGTDTKQFAWNENGTLASVTLPAGLTSAHLYGSDGLRVSKAVAQVDGTGTELTHYPNPYYTALIKRTVPAGCDGEACLVETHTRAKHVRLDGRTLASVIGIAEPGSTEGEIEISYLDVSPHYAHADQVLSTTLVSGQDASSVSTYEYLPFGELLNGASSQHEFANYSDQAFNGMEYDAEVDFYYFGARYYSPDLSKWVSKDPVQSTEYFFAAFRNNPINFFDPTGMQSGRAESWRSQRQAMEAHDQEQLYTQEQYEALQDWEDQQQSFQLSIDRALEVFEWLSSEIAKDKEDAQAVAERNYLQFVARHSDWVGIQGELLLQSPLYFGGQANRSFWLNLDTGGFLDVVTPSFRTGVGMAAEANVQIGYWHGSMQSPETHAWGVDVPYGGFSRTWSDTGEGFDFELGLGAGLNYGVWRGAGPSYISPGLDAFRGGPGSLTYESPWSFRR